MWIVPVASKPQDIPAPNTPLFEGEIGVGNNGVSGGEENVDMDDIEPPFMRCCGSGMPNASGEGYVDDEELGGESMSSSISSGSKAATPPVMESDKELRVCVLFDEVDRTGEPSAPASDESEDRGGREDTFGSSDCGPPLASSTTTWDSSKCSTSAWRSVKGSPQHE
jgi:hypothetical protein